MGFKFATFLRERTICGPEAEFGTCSQYSYPVCSQLDADSDAIYGVAIGEIGVDVHVKLGDSL